MGHVSDDGRFFIPKIECAQMRTMLEVVAGSDAFCATFQQMISSEGSLVALDLRPEWLCTKYGVMHLKGHAQSRSAKAFTDAAIKAERLYFET